MKRLSAAIVVLLLSVMFTIGGSLAYDNAVYGGNQEFSPGTIEQNNVMTAGTFDVDVSEGGIDSSNPITISHDIDFNSQNWEPGYADAGIIKVITSVNVSYTISLTNSGSLSELADVIDVYYANGDVTTMNSRVDFVNALHYAGTVREVIESNDSDESAHKITGTLQAKSEVIQPVSLVFKMRESAGNHYQDMALCDGGFTVTFTATETQ